MTQQKPLLLLFDGNALVHRAFHAIPPLTITRTGEMVNAVQGFASTILKVLNEIKPTHWAIAFDRPGPTFRHEQFQDYKAQRPKAPPELVSQMQRAHELADAFHLPAFEIDGYEADDVLATLSKQASDQGVDTIIVTGDNDILQLVSPNIKVMSPRRTFSDTVIYDGAAVQEKYGIAPNQLVYLKALTGDPSDNIPGIAGIGDKTAAKLLNRFGTLEEIYAHIDEVIPEKLQNSLREHKEQVLRNQELATVVADVPVALDMDTCRVSAYDRQRVVELFRELGFAQLLSRLPEDLGGAPAPTHIHAMTKGDYHIVSTEKDLDELVARLSAAKEFAVDVETSSKQPMEAELVGISLASAAGQAFYIPLGHRSLTNITQLPLSHVIDKLKPALEDTKIAKIAQNGKFDMTVLAEHGINLQNLAFDTMLAAYLLGEKSLGLKALAFNKLGIEMTPITDLIGKGPKQISMSLAPIEETADYACADADVTLRLKDVLENDLHREELWQLFNEVEMPLVPVLMDMERTGVALDSDLLREMSHNLGKEMLRLEAEIYNSVGYKFNINSSQQLSRILYEDLKLPRPRKTKSGYTTEASTLEELKGTHPAIELILQYRQLAKLKSTYADAFPALVNPRTGRLHTSFNQTGTTTGRLSSSEPNMQNLPVRGELGGKIRQAIIARPGWFLLSADYSQIDLRALAHISQDEELVATFTRDEDVHTATASRVFNVPPENVTPAMRRVAKTVNFGVIYGMSDYGLEQATDFSRDEAAQFIASYFQKYPRVKDYIETTKAQAGKLGYVQTVMGRRRYIPELNSPNRQVKEAAERMAINMPVQGTSADIIKIAMVRLHRQMQSRNLKSKMTLQIHDELLFEVPPEEIDIMKSLVSEIMPNALQLRVPLKIDIKQGKNWAEME
ncbi:MAG: DNA polymerase I [Chloroflexi bacterium]|nr:DNA polymerase I [Chloroflexota bacterium]MBM3175309.1 DNA polymerase I [Chloroflexota bacterium]MBM4450646.1 DNA polymerase I [Chloroflexota bacterium]